MDAKPKLLYLITSSAWGGAERYVARLAAAARSGFDVTVAAGSSARSELFKALPNGIRTFEIPALRRPISPWNDLKAVNAVRKMIDREGYALIHSNSSKAGLIAALAVRLSKRRPALIFTAHGWGFLERRPFPFRLLMLASEKLASLWRSATIVLTETERAVALDKDLSVPARLHLIPLGIDPDEIAFLGRDAALTELSKACGVPAFERIIGTIANSYPAKNLPMLLEAFDAVAGEFPDVDLVVIGDGPKMPELLARRSGLAHRARICLPGALPDAARLLKAFDLFILPSTKEGLPWAILEASLAGVPIIATRVGALPELIEDGETGLLIPPADRERLVSAIRSVLAGQDLSQKLKSGAPRIAERRSGSSMVASTLELYQDLMRRSRRFGLDSSRSK